VKEKIKNIGEGLLGFGVLIVIFIAGGLLIILFIEGGVWLSTVLYPWLLRIFWITIGIILFILLPLGAFMRTRIISAIGFLVASYIFGATLWTWSFLVAYSLWGFLGLLIGLFFFGGGVIPIAVLASLFNAEWGILFQLILLVLFVYGTRIFAFYLEEKTTQNDYFEPEKISTFPIGEGDIEEAKIGDYRETEGLYCGVCGEKADSDSVYCQKCGNKM
jgi:hypothetical protein